MLEQLIAYLCRKRRARRRARLAPAPAAEPTPYFYYVIGRCRAPGCWIIVCDREGRRRREYEVWFN